MAQRMIQKDEIQKIVEIMRFAPIREGESHNAYYKRICGAVNRSRTTLQVIEQAMKPSSDPDVIYQEYARLSRERDSRKRDREQKKKDEKYIEQLYQTFSSETNDSTTDKTSADEKQPDDNVQDKFLMKIRMNFLTLAYPRMFAHFDGKPFELCTRDGTHYVTIKFDDLAWLFLTPGERLGGDI